jgi:hypothetical protein
VPDEKVADDGGSDIGPPECLPVAEAWHDYGGSVRERVNGQVGGTVGVLELSADYESWGLDARKVRAVSGRVRPALELESRHIGWGGFKVVPEPLWRRLRFAAPNLFQMFAEPDLTEPGRHHAPALVGCLSRERDTSDPDNRSDTLRMTSSERVHQAASIGVTDHRGPINPGGVQHGDDVSDVFVEPVCFRMLGLVALSMTSVVE